MYERERERDFKSYTTHIPVHYTFNEIFNKILIGEKN